MSAAQKKKRRRACPLGGARYGGAGERRGLASRGFNRFAPSRADAPARRHGRPRVFEAHGSGVGNAERVAMPRTWSTNSETHTHTRGHAIFFSLTATAATTPASCANFGDPSSSAAAAATTEAVAIARCLSHCRERRTVVGQKSRAGQKVFGLGRSYRPADRVQRSDRRGPHTRETKGKKSLSHPVAGEDGPRPHQWVHRRWRR
jgi:hypothetical protein